MWQKVASAEARNSNFRRSGWESDQQGAQREEPVVQASIPTRKFRKRRKMLQEEATILDGQGGSAKADQEDDVERISSATPKLKNRLSEE